MKSNVMANVTVFVDESGNLGFDKGGSSFFVIGFVMMINDNPFFNRNKVTRLLRHINTKQKHKRKISEFKFSEDSHLTRMKFLNLIKVLPVVSSVVLVSKDSVMQHLRNDPIILYNYLAVEYIITKIINDHLKPSSPYNTITYTIDESLTKKAQQNFNRYCQDKISYLSKDRPFVANIITKIQHLNSQYDPCLQIADYIASATFQKFERNNPQYLDVIKDKIKKPVFWDIHRRITW
ncbi:MAG: DUF3800 domain-containing protein [Thaumarchaeota archaeon]|nr:DUF3800 domain-containing protein [Nitrososphaerota archaeon]